VFLVKVEGGSVILVGEELESGESLFGGPLIEGNQKGVTDAVTTEFLVNHDVFNEAGVGAFGGGDEQLGGTHADYLMRLFGDKYLGGGAVQEKPESGLLFGPVGGKVGLYAEQLFEQGRHVGYVGLVGRSNLQGHVVFLFLRRFLKRVS
jgi:hypothetical protein